MSNNPANIDALKNEIITAKSEYERLLEEISELKALIITLTAERDELKYHICRDLAAEYNTRIGILELQALTAKLQVLELKRTIEIIQAAINRQERKSEKKARQQAREEYRQFEEDLNRKAEEAKNTDRYKEDASKKEEEWQQEQAERARNEGSEDRTERYKSRTDEMKALYRKIVKAFHPDMNPDQTDEEKALFQEAVDAYNNGDLDKLREIAAMIDEGNIGKDITDSPKDIARLKEIIEGLKHRVEMLREEIESIKTSFPYTMKEFLADEDAVYERQKELTELISEYAKQARELEERLTSMLGK